jgi:hypothetical protein
MNIAQIIKSYYESEDFQGNYADFLLEDSSVILYNLQQVSCCYEFEKKYGVKDLSIVQCKKILSHIRSNALDYISTYWGYYGGDLCIDSISFGEQEESIKDLINHKTGKPYTKRYLRKVFESEDYYVCDSGQYAYCDLSSEGLKVTLNNLDKETLLTIISET